jgi:hypothetical protein
MKQVWYAQIARSRVLTYLTYQENVIQQSHCVSYKLCAHPSWAQVALYGNRGR